MKPNQIKASREALRLTQGQLAEIFGCKFNTISRWERGDSECEFPGMLTLAFQALEAQKANDLGEVLSRVDAQIDRLKAARTQLAGKGGKVGKTGKI